MHSHPIPTVFILTVTFVAVYQGIVNDAFQAFVWPWLKQPVKTVMLLLVGLATLITLLSLLLIRTLLENARLATVADSAAPYATQQRLHNAQIQRDHAVRWLDVGIETLSIAVDVMRTLNPDEGFLSQLVEPSVQLVLQDAQGMFAHRVPRASVYAVNPTNKECLSVAYHVGLDEKTISNARFYIGSDQRRRRQEEGTAGLVFRTKKSVVRHIDPKTLEATDGREYVRIDRERRVLVYESFATVPILYDDRCLGVLCLDSPSSDCFGAAEDLLVLRPTTRLLAELLRLRERAIELQQGVQSTGK